MTIHLYAAGRLLFVPNQPNRRIPCAKPVLFHNFFFENSKKNVKPLNRYFEFKKNVRIIFFLKKKRGLPRRCLWYPWIVPKRLQYRERAENVQSEPVEPGLGWRRPPYNLGAEMGDSLVVLK